MDSGLDNATARGYLFDVNRWCMAHGTPCVTATSARRSEGCAAMEPDRAERLPPLLADGRIVFIDSPRDARRLDEDPWIGAAHPAPASDHTT